MQPPSPINANIRTLMIQLNSGINGTSTWNLTKLKETWKPRTIIFSNIIVLTLFLVCTAEAVSNKLVGLYIMRSNSFQVLNIIWWMKLCHLLISRSVWLINIHFSVKAVCKDQLVSHCDSKRSHRVAFTVQEWTDISYFSQKILFFNFVKFWLIFLKRV